MSVALKMELPDGAFSALRKSPDEFVREMRLTAAVKWYEMTLISQEKAAEIPSAGGAGQGRGYIADYYCLPTLKGQMGRRRQIEEKIMKCHSCGDEFASVITDLPFKTGDHSIVIIKGLPLLQCSNCGEFLIEDAVMARVDAIIDSIEQDIEVEVVRYAA